MNKNTLISFMTTDKVFKGTVTNQALPYLHGGSLEITLTVPLNRLKEKIDTPK